jgi:WD40 repeat protein
LKKSKNITTTINVETLRFDYIYKELRETMFARRSLALYGGHDDEINCLIFSHDLEILLTASVNGFIRLWNTVFDHLTFKIQEDAGMLINKTILKSIHISFT